MEPPRRGRLSSALAAMLEPLYYWLDLYGPDGEPANTKVLSAWGFFMALSMELWWGWHLSHPHCPDGVAPGTEAAARACVEPAGVNWPFVVLVLATLSVAMGKDVFKAALKMRSNAQDSRGG